MTTGNVLDTAMTMRALLDRYTDAVNQRDWGHPREALCGRNENPGNISGQHVPEMSFGSRAPKIGAQGIAGLVSPMEPSLQSNHAQR